MDGVKKNKIIRRPTVFDGGVGWGGVNTRNRADNFGKAIFAHCRTRSDDRLCDQTSTACRLMAGWVGGVRRHIAEAPSVPQD